MKDYVNTQKPTAFQFFWKRHGEGVQLAVFVLAIGLIGSLGV